MPRIEGSPNRAMNQLPRGSLLLAVLAAGGSQRLGRRKQLVMIAGEPLLRRQCRIALDSQLGPVAAILGCCADECAETIRDLPVQPQLNSRWEEGLGGSIATAGRLAIALDARGLLLMHVDQHRLTAADLQALHADWSTAGEQSVCVAQYGDDFGPPVIFLRNCFNSLVQLRGESGARGLLAALPAEMLRNVAMPNAADDLDLPEHLAAARRPALNRPPPPLRGSAWLKEDSKERNCG